MKKGCTDQTERFIAKMEHRLPRGDAEKLEEHLASCDACAQDYESLQGLVGLLEEAGAHWRAMAPRPASNEELLQALRERLADADEAAEDEDPALIAVEAALLSAGNDVRAAAPKIDIRDDVMASIRNARGTDKANVTPFQKRRSFRKWLAPAMAAAFLLATGLVFFQQVMLQTEAPVRVARAPETPAPPAAPETAVDQTLPAVPDLPEVSPPPTPAQPDVAEAPAAAPPAPAPEPITLREAINARRLAAMNNSSALQQLADWASLTPEEAREVLAQSGLTTDAIVGAAKFLPPEEAIAVLRAALADQPDNVDLRYALAKAYREHGGMWEEHLAQLYALRGSDPGNSLPIYMTARTLLEQGRIEEGLNALAFGSSMNRADAYDLEQARQREAALIASGMDPDTARYLAAVQAGTGAYTDITGVAQGLMAEARDLEAQGDYEAAQQIYQSLYNMGDQAAQNASVTNARLAGLDVQSDAMRALEGVLGILQEPETGQVIGDAWTGIVDDLTELTDIMAELDRLLTSQDIDYVNWLAELILESGNLIEF